MQAFVMIDSLGIMISVDVNVKNWLIKFGIMVGLCRILACVHVNVINPETLVNTSIALFVNREKDWLISWSKNVMRILMKMKWFKTRIYDFGLNKKAYKSFILYVITLIIACILFNYEY